MSQLTGHPKSEACFRPKKESVHILLSRALYQSLNYLSSEWPTFQVHSFHMSRDDLWHLQACILHGAQVLIEGVSFLPISASKFQGRI